MITLARAGLFLLFLTSSAMTYVYYGFYSAAGRDDCFASSSVICDPAEYTKPLLLWASIVAISFIVAIILPLRYRPKLFMKN